MEFKKALKAVVCDIDVPCRAYETSISCRACKLRITCPASNVFQDPFKSYSDFSRSPSRLRVPAQKFTHGMWIMRACCTTFFTQWTWLVSAATYFLKRLAWQKREMPHQYLFVVLSATIPMKCPQTSKTGTKFSCSREKTSFGTCAHAFDAWNGDGGPR